MSSTGEKSKEIVANTQDFHENPFLKLLKTTKKEKQYEKSASFQNSIASGSFSGISKSALRRRKRKAKQQLKPKMEDLLTTITDEIETQPSESAQYIASSKGRENLPNAANKSGRSVIMRQEHDKFNHVLQDATFRNLPFAALKNAIANNMASKQ